ncbi:MAG: cell division protein ZapA [Thalassobius sp.]|nr:cell division protein ZapA [Thalassovita sp.]
MKDFFIKIKIADRTYSLKIKPEDEEILRQAAKAIENKLKLRQEQMRINDKQDLLAMVAFDAEVEKLKEQKANEHINKSIDTINDQLNNMLDEF